MNRYRQRALAVTLCILGGAALAQSEALKVQRMTPDDVTWPPPAAAGYQVSPIVGSSSKQGMYVSRVKFPPGLKIPPHFHPDDRVVTVLSGTMYVGYGEAFDDTKMQALPPGSLWTEPAKTPHFVWAKDGEVIIQVVGVGPSGITQVTR